jgi:hypothetical protein
MQRILLIVFLFAQNYLLAQSNQQQEKVRVIMEGTDSTFLINTIDLIGIWTGLSSHQPILNNQVINNPSIEIQFDALVKIKDGWQEDYPNKLRNTTWKIIDHELWFLAPDLGKIPVTLVALRGGSRFELIVNSSTYRRLISLSAKR